MPERPAAQLFYSYSHKDEKLRDRLEVHLAALKREGLIFGWHDRKIGAGTEWKNAIDDHLKAASIILLLVSADFLASDYCYDIELRYAMDRHQKGAARVIPVILQPCDWQTSSFAGLQALPKDAKPVTKWSNRNDAFVNIAAGIRKALEDMGQGGSPAPVPKHVSSPTISASAPIIYALHGLPAPPADFTGRTEELQELLEAVKTGGVTISGLQGMGGVGKTALALKFANQLKDDYSDAQFYVDLKGVTHPLAPKEAMAHVIRAWNPMQQLPEKEEDVAALYRSVLDGKRALLLMDNARDADQVRSLIPPSSCLLLVTSRKHFALPGLVEKNLDKLPHADAYALLVKIAPRLGKGGKDVIKELASLCGHLPLALEKVASALRVKANISPTDYARRLADAQQRLKLTETDAALQQSYDVLSQRLRRRFRFLGVFPDTFDLPAAAAIWEMKPEEALDRLSELLAYSLIEYDETTRRYRLHDLLCLFADQRLSDEERMTTQKRHARHYLVVLAAADQLYLQAAASVTAGLSLFDLEVGNIRSGQAWAALHANHDKQAAEWCCQYTNAGVYCLNLRQHPREQIRWLQTALSAERKLKRRDWEGTTLSRLGLAYKDLGEHRRAIEYHENALEIVRDTGNRKGEAISLGNLGLAYLDMGEYRNAIKYSEQALEIARETDNQRSESAALGNLGSAYGGLGEYHRAIEYLEQALNLDRHVGNRLGEGQDLGNLGTTYRILGRYSLAVEYYEQRLAIAREIGDQFGEAYGQFNSARALYDLGKRDQAIARAEAALKICEAIESPLGAEVLAVLAEWRQEEQGNNS